MMEKRERKKWLKCGEWRNPSVTVKGIRTDAWLRVSLSYLFLATLRSYCC